MQPARTPDGRPVFVAEPGGPGFTGSGPDPGGARIAVSIVLAVVLLGLIAAIVVPSFVNQRAPDEGQASGGKQSQLEPDGYSSLPGGHARLTYTLTDSQTEWIRETNVDAPFDGSQWWLADTRSDDQIMLRYYRFVPPIDNDVALQRAIAGAQGRATNASADPVVLETIKVGDTDAQRFRYTNRKGREVLTVWIFGPVHSYQFDCNVSSAMSPMLAQCEQALATLRVDP